MSLFDFVDFGDNNTTSAAPSGRPKTKSTAKPVIDRPVGAQPPARKPKVETIVEVEPVAEPKPIEIEKPLVESSYQPVSVDEYNFDNSVTIHILKEFFNKKDKIGKDNIICYADRKTMFGKKLTATDKVIELGILNAQHALSNNFISTTFKLIADSEIRQIAKLYTTFGAVRWYPLVVEIQYIVDPKHNNVLMCIQDQFL